MGGKEKKITGSQDPNIPESWNSGLPGSMVQAGAGRYGQVGAGAGGGRCGQVGMCAGKIPACVREFVPLPFRYHHLQFC